MKKEEKIKSGRKHMKRKQDKIKSYKKRMKKKKPKKGSGATGALSTYNLANAREAGPITEEE